MSESPKFHRQHYYALAKDLRELKRTLRVSDGTGNDYITLERLEEKLCARFAKDNPEYDPAMWHRYCAEGKDTVKMRWVYCVA
jgi:hypothetical protein